MTGKAGISKLHRADFGHVKAHFLTLAGRDDEALTLLTKTGTKGYRPTSPEDTHESAEAVVALIMEAPHPRFRNTSSTDHSAPLPTPNFPLALKNTYVHIPHISPPADPLATMNPHNPGQSAADNLGPISPSTLGQRASFGVAAAVVCHTLWTSAAPVMSYRLYAAEWHLTPTATTAIFAVYPIVVVAMLVLFGNLSDHIGRRKAILWGLAASITGVLCFAIAPNVTWIFIGRAFMGVGVGLSASPATAAMVEFSAPGKADRAGAFTTAAQSAGLALAMLIGGGLIQYAPYPTHLNFWVLATILVGLFATAWFLPRHTTGEAAGRWSPRLPSIPTGMIRIFATSAAAITSAYAIGAMMLSLGGQIEHDVIGSSNALINGAVMAAFAIISGVTAIFAKRLPAPAAIMSGGSLTALGMGLLVLSATQHSLATFLIAIIAAGAGFSLSLLGGLGLISAHSPAHHRGGTLSAVYLIAYLMQGVIALLLGKAATAWGLATSVQAGSAFIATFGLATIVLASLPLTPRRTVAGIL